MGHVFKRKQQVLTFVLLCIILLVGYIVKLFFTGNHQGSFSEMNRLFDLSIREDKAIRMNKARVVVYSGYETGAPDSLIEIKVDGKDSVLIKKDVNWQLKEAEKGYRADQAFLKDKNPINVHTLDSLFLSELRSKNIPALAEIIYIADHDTIYSSSDRSFYSTAYPLTKISTGIDDEIQLQAFVKIPLFYWVFKERGVLIFLLVILILMTICIFWLFIAKKQEATIPLPALKTLNDLAEASEQALGPVVQITPDLYFEETSGVLTYNDKVLYLQNYQLAMFKYLLNSPDYFLKTEDIKLKVWTDGTSTQDSFTKTVQRLRLNLESIPDLHILFDQKRKGYYLEIKSKERQLN